MLTLQEIEAAPWLGDQRAQVRELYERAQKLARFKAYVHERLDTAGVPADPEPEANEAHGCRVEGRLNFLVARAEKAERCALAYFTTMRAIATEARQHCSERLRGWERWQKALNWIDEAVKEYGL